MCIQVQTGIHEYGGSNTFLCPSSITHMMSTPPAAAVFLRLQREPPALEQELRVRLGLVEREDVPLEPAPPRDALHVRLLLVGAARSALSSSDGWVPRHHGQLLVGDGEAVHTVVAMDAGIGLVALISRLASHPPVVNVAPVQHELGPEDQLLMLAEEVRRARRGSRRSACAPATPTRALRSPHHPRSSPSSMV